MLGPIDYEVIRIEGDYGILRRLDGADTEEKLVARALLPEAIREGSKLHYEMLEYSLMD